MMFSSIATQAQPTVVTDSRYARGATMAFGRIKSVKANGSPISFRGFCCATNPNPTCEDILSSSTPLTHNDYGTIYCLEDLQPATLYYMRAYAKAKDGSIGYGDVIKFYTLPKGNITYSYNNGGSAAENQRINNALTQACDIFNNLTCINKHFNVGYGSGTPTADCNYRDEPWMNVGPNQSYQRTGTIMHEMQHGLGVIPYSTQWNKNILRETLDNEGRGTGHWLGERVSAFLDFWNNTSGSQLNGDYQHMWPYGINGAHEDGGDLWTYYANAMIGQALGEDGLEHRYNTFADPCYIFMQEDTIKYYLKNEDADRGLYSAYLMPNATGALKWRTIATEDALQNDSAAWYITFTPNNQYYQLRNAATGQYMTYASNNFKTAKRTTLTASDNFHLMKGRVNVGSGKNAKRGYWLIHPTNDWSPTCLTANANSATTAQTFDLSNGATKQRWLILTADEIKVFEDAIVTQMRAEINNTLVPIKALYDVPHTCSPAEADQAFADAISNFEQTISSTTSASMLAQLTEQIWPAAQAFLNAATPTNAEQPFNLTFLVKNAGMDAADGWSVAPTIDYSCGEFFEKTFVMRQKLEQMPLGTYRLQMQGFQRPGTYTEAYNDWAEGKNNVNAFLYLGSNNIKIAHILDGAQTTIQLSSDKKVGGKYYVPNNMQGASKYFSRGFYENCLYATTTETSWYLGIRSSSMQSSYWCIFDNFRLNFFGTMTEEQITGIDNININDNVNLDIDKNCYDLQGRPVLHPSKGLYIIKGKKTVIR